jgi:DnaK suppressor protein
MGVEPNESSRYEQMLVALRDVLASLEDVRRDGSAVVELDQTRTGRLSRVDALQLQAMASAGRERAALEIRRIDAALARIHSGTYGACVQCGEQIVAARLEAQPATALCLACAQAREASNRRT